MSRGLTAKQLLEGSRWLSGPEFLWKSGARNPERGKVSFLLETDPEVKKASVLTTEVKTVVSFPGHFESSRLDGVSSWYRATKVIALCLQLKSKLLAREVKEPGKPVAKSNDKEEKPVRKLSLPELQQAEKTIIKCLQYENFREELEVLRHINATSAETSSDQSKKKRQVLRKASSLYKLDPFLDQDGLIRVGGRIRRANLSVDRKHPVREGVQISGHTDADADQSVPILSVPIETESATGQTSSSGQLQTYQFLTYICQRLSKDCNRQSRYVTDKNYVGQRLCQQKRSVND